MDINSEILTTLGVTAVALALFVFEWLPPDIIALMVMVALMVLGLVTPGEGIAGFSNSAVITVMAMFILSEGIDRSGALQRASYWLSKWGGKTTRRQIFALGLIVGPISGLINNTAVVSVFLPIIEDFCQQHRISPSKLMIPLSFLTVLGGMLTVVGTSTSILASGLSEQLGYGTFSLFQFSALGLLTFIAGLLFLTFAGPFLLPNREVPGNSLSQEYGLKDYVSEVVVTPRSSLVGQTLKSSQLQRRFDLDVLEIIRNDNHFPQPLGDKPLCAGDILLVRGGRQDLLKIRDGEGIEILPDVQFGQKSWQADLSSDQEGVAEAMVVANSNVVGSTLKDLRFRQRYNVTVLAIRRGQELVRDRLGKLTLKFGDLLLVQGPKQSLLGLQTSRDLLVLEQTELEGLRFDRANIAVGIGLAVVAVAAFTSIDILVSSLAGVVLMILTGCLKPGELYESVRWDVIFLLACLIPLGTAMETSGATAWLAQQLIGIGGSLSGYGLLTMLYVLTSLLTNILSNSASVILLLPVGVKVATELGINPFAVMFIVTFAASNAFMTPIGYQTNTMVYTAGGYRFLDFFRIGAPLSLLLALMTPPLVIWLYGI
ncbi:SLC13 family permease [Leptothoe sp. PORK10 BA2]|uniref:SLC13 family permease n=1 Tax=Leptothoe sp. PORK10 BA2 TaxID=3110254 RepID=UPI002B20B6FF|nr:SLC13 family permease [Leptothoe sp. PORK10 BA2]MEA5465428.1 SLC13 family permease [Leptothoe sp. PORK10 BA2]